MVAYLRQRLLRFLCLACFMTVLLALTAPINPACSQTSAAGAALSAEFDAPTRDLLRRRIAALRAQITAIESQIARLRQRMPQIEDEIKLLMERVGSIKLPEEETEELPEKEPRAVAFRPPFLRKLKKETPLVLVCEEGRVSILDFERQEREFNKIADNKDALRSFVKSGGGKLDADDFEVVVRIIIAGSRLIILQEAARKPGHNGESLSMARQPRSRLRKRLAQLDANKSVIQFAVYPDSFDTLREIRKIVWQKKFSVNWMPMSHGEKITIGDGSSGVGVQ